MKRARRSLGDIDVETILSSPRRKLKSRPDEQVLEEPIHSTSLEDMKSSDAVGSSPEKSKSSLMHQKPTRNSEELVGKRQSIGRQPSRALDKKVVRSTGVILNFQLPTDNDENKKHSENRKNSAETVYDAVNITESADSVKSAVTVKLQASEESEHSETVKSFICIQFCRSETFGCRHRELRLGNGSKNH